MGLLARFIGVMTSPRATFQSVAAHPKWLGVLLIVTVIVAAGVSLPLTTAAGQQSQLDNQVRAIESFGGEVNAGDVRSMQRSMRFAPVQTFVTILIMGPLMSVIFSGILFGVVHACSAARRRSSSCSRSTSTRRSSPPSAQLFTGPLNYFRGSMSSATNLAVLLPMVSEQSFLGRLLGMIDSVLDLVAARAVDRPGVLYRRADAADRLHRCSGLRVIGAGPIAAVMSLLGRSN